MSGEEMEGQGINTVWPGWNVVQRIGTGSYGTVYEVEREMFGNREKAAVKVISIPQNESEIEELRMDGYDQKSITARYRDYMQTVVREYSVMAKMKGCANIVYCDDVRCIQHADGIGWDIFIKMELLTPLTKTLYEGITEAQVIKLGAEMCNALAFCEQYKVLHRDIKPQNIFVSEDGTYKLGDFGVAKTVEKTLGGTVAGTYNYMAPEVFNNQPYGARADLYSLGLVLYWLLNEKRLPFLPLPPEVPTASMEERARTRRFRGEPIPAPVNGSQNLRQCVLTACAFDPNARFSGAEEMRRWLLSGGASPGNGTVRLFGPKGTDEGMQSGPQNQYGGSGEKQVILCGPTDSEETMPKTGDSGAEGSDSAREKPRKKKRALLWLILPVAAVAAAAVVFLVILPWLRNHGGSGTTQQASTGTAPAKATVSLSAGQYQPKKTERFGKNLYELYDVSMSWTEARDYCSSIGGHLLTINTQSEQDFITEFAKESMNLYWLGMSSQSGADAGSWITGEARRFANWSQGEPAGTGWKAQMLGRPSAQWKAGDWRAVSYEGGADAASGMENVGFICEYEEKEACDWIVYKNSATRQIEMLCFPEQETQRAVTFDPYGSQRLALADGSDIPETYHYYLNSAYLWEHDKCQALSDARADEILFASVRVENADDDSVTEPSAPSAYRSFEICNQAPQNGGSKAWWVVFEEGYRDNQVEMNVFQHTACQIIWDNAFSLEDGSDFGVCKQYFINEFGRWEYARDYTTISNYAPKVIASNTIVKDSAGNEIVTPGSDAAFIGIAGQEAFKQGIITSLKLSGKYSYVIDDCKWESAFDSALLAEGRLAQIETEDEFLRVIAELNALGLQNIEFRVGARRDGTGDGYYWVDENNQFIGDRINSEGHWMEDQWCEGEPSFTWKDHPELVLEVYYDRGAGAWVWNDISNEVYRSDIGEYGYIIEFG